MNRFPTEAKRVLAIDPTSKGFGFAVLEGPTVLIDWGVKHARSDRNAKCLEHAAELVSRYRPEVLVAEQARVELEERGVERVEQLQTLGRVARGGARSGRNATDG